jgi:hypothetical protein
VGTPTSGQAPLLVQVRESLQGQGVKGCVSGLTEPHRGALDGLGIVHACGAMWGGGGGGGGGAGQGCQLGKAQEGTNVLQQHRPPPTVIVHSIEVALGKGRVPALPEK